MRCISRNFLHFFQCCRTLSAIAAVVFFCPLLFADTTWVAGDVFGVWDTTGSPFMVTDTITVPMDSTLEIRPGVKIWFLDQEIRETRFYVYGSLLAVGLEADSIYFLSEGGPFWGINAFDYANTVIRMEYCVVDSIGHGIWSRDGIMVIKHCRLHRQGNDPVGIIRGTNDIVTVQYCEFTGGGVYLYGGGPVVYQHNRGGFFTGHWIAMEPIYDNQGSSINLSNCSPTLGYDNIFERVRCYETNTTWHHNRISEYFRAELSYLTIYDNYIGDVILRYTETNCYNNEIFGEVNSDGSNIDFQKNLIVSPDEGFRVHAYGSYYIIIKGNTIVFNSTGMVGVIHSNSLISVVDNIFVGDGVNCTGIWLTRQDPITISYNDFYQINTITINCELDTGNIFEDPRLRAGMPFDYQLQANSPCIDAGDPTSPLDPDGTRADMGAYYFNQLIDHPPALISPVVVNVHIGDSLRYVALATDDYGPLLFSFSDLPPWLNIEGLDWVEDSTAVSGTVPLDQEDFTFGVRVEDGLAQWDVQEVTVLVSQITVLAGEVTGVLTLEESPYLVAEDVVVPAGDSLTIEPGVEIRFQWHEVQDLRHRIVVRGKLHAVGTPQDSIRFIPEYGDSLFLAWRGVNIVGSPEDTTTISYAYFLNAHSGIVVDSNGVLNIDHSTIMDSFYGIRANHGGSVRVDSCQFYTYYPNACSFITVDSASVTVSNSYFESGDPVLPDMHFDVQYNSNGVFRGCTFINGLSARFNMHSYGEYIGNRMINVAAGLGYGNGSSGIIANNIFSGGDGVLVYSGDSLLISNNLFYHNEIGVDFTYFPDEVYVKNNIFLENEYGLYLDYGSEIFEDFYYCDFFGNDSNFVGCGNNPTNIFNDPLVQDTVDFYLQLGSPCIDAGDPDPFFNDPDSTRNDIGCWGGPWGQSYPYSPVLSQLSKPLPLEFALLPPYPNPFNSVLVIPFTIPTQSDVQIAIYNILGQRVDQFDFSPVSPGAHRIQWNATTCASGIYIVRLMAGDREFNQKVVLLR